MGTLFEQLLRRLRERAAGGPPSSPALSERPAPLAPATGAPAVTQAQGQPGAPVDAASAPRAEASGSPAAPVEASTARSAAPAAPDEAIAAPGEVSAITAEVPTASPDAPSPESPVPSGGESGPWRLVLPLEPLDPGMSPGDDPGEVIPLEQVRTTLPPSEIVTADEAPDRPEPGYTLCLRCLGWGEVTSPARCPVCLGAREDWCEGISIPCKACHGTGRVNIPCPACEGNGWVREELVEEPQPAEEPEAQPPEVPSPAGGGTAPHGTAHHGTASHVTVPRHGEPVADGPPSPTDLGQPWPGLEERNGKVPL